MQEFRLVRTSAGEREGDWEQDDIELLSPDDPAAIVLCRRSASSCGMGGEKMRTTNESPTSSTQMRMLCLVVKSGWVGSARYAMRASRGSWLMKATNTFAVSTEKRAVASTMRRIPATDTGQFKVALPRARLFSRSNAQTRNKHKNTPASQHVSAQPRRSYNFFVYRRTVERAFDG